MPYHMTLVYMSTCKKCNAIQIHIMKTQLALCYAVQFLSSAYLFLSNVLVENERQLARVSSKETYQPVEMDTKASW